MPVVICPRDGMALNWDFDSEDRAGINAFTSQFAASPTFKSVVIPKERILKQIKIWMQGRLGSCQGQAITKCVQALYFFATGKVVPLSALKAYIDSQKEDGLLGADRGSTIRGGILMAQKGLAEESACPYRDTYPTAAEIRHIVEIARDLRYSIKCGLNVESWQHLRELTAGGMVASIGTYWPFRIEADWFVNTWQPMPRGGGHARAFVGNFKDGCPGEDNSWDVDWGDEGRFWWRENAFNQCLKDPRTVCTAISELSVPEARRVDIAEVIWGKTDGA